MRHGNAFRKLSRTAAHRRSLLRNMVTSLIERETCTTTVEKAKELRPVVEKFIRLGATDSIHARRQAYSYLMSKKVVHKLFTDVGPRFKNRAGGYTRIVRSGYRHGDAAEMAIIEFVEKPDVVKAIADGNSEKKAAAPKKAKASAADKSAAKAKAAGAAEKKPRATTKKKAAAV